METQMKEPIQPQKIEPFDMNSIKKFEPSPKTPDKRALKKNLIRTFAFYPILILCMLVFFFMPELVKNLSDENKILIILIVLIAFRLLSRIVSRRETPINTTDTPTEILLFRNLIWLTAANLNNRLMIYNEFYNVIDREESLDNYEKLKDIKSRLEFAYQYAQTIKEQPDEAFDHEYRLMELANRDVKKIYADLFESKELIAE
jgi:hypothetical protein